MKILMSVYSCQPGMGSEPGIGWNWAVQAARFNDVWILTSTENRSAIQSHLARHPIPNLHAVYHRLPEWSERIAKPGTSKKWAEYWHMYVWQTTAVSTARALHASIGFDIAHHVTFGSIRNWSYLPALGIPFIWGPVGGGEQTPMSFLRESPLQVRLKEAFRNRVNALVKLDPLVRHTVRSSHMVLATTEESLRMLPAVAKHKTSVMQNIGLNRDELPHGRQHRSNHEFRMLFIGRLLYWKGVDLAIEAMQHLDNSKGPTSLTIIGDGPDRKRLESVAKHAGVASRVIFRGQVNRESMLVELNTYDCFIFPSLHDSGGFAVLEAMAAELPVVCLRAGGPAISVTDECGILVDVGTRDQVIRDLSSAIQRLKDEPGVRLIMGREGRQRINERYLWDRLAPSLSEIYESMVSVSS